MSELAAQREQVAEHIASLFDYDRDSPRVLEAADYILSREAGLQERRLML